MFCLQGAQRTLSTNFRSENWEPNGSAGRLKNRWQKVAISNEEKFKVENFSEKNKGRLYSTGPPVLTGPVVELAAMKAKLNEAEMALTASRSALEVIERSWSWKIGRAMTLPVTLLRNRFHKFHAD